MSRHHDPRRSFSTAFAASRTVTHAQSGRGTRHANRHRGARRTRHERRPARRARLVAITPADDSTEFQAVTDAEGRFLFGACRAAAISSPRRSRDG